MYLKHFGLKSKPFGATADGAAVFLSPRQSEQIKTLHQGLGAQDAVVTVTGPVGVGKTTFVNKGLEVIHPGRLVAAVGRMRLEPEDLFALLLSGFGISRKTKGTIRQIGAFRRYLHERAATGLQVAIVVEDAQRIGIDALVELEALTAADSGATSSANLILMGQPGLGELLSKPDLARLKQRVRQRVYIEPLTGPEMLGYMKHTLRQAGGEYDAIFEDGVADIVAGCSEGIPRLINTLCEETLNAAAEENLAKITPQLMAKIAASTFGYEAELVAPPVTTAAAPAEPESLSDKQPDSGSGAVADDDVDWESPPEVKAPERVPVIANSAVAALAARSEIGHDIVVESGRYPEKPESPSEPPASAGTADVGNEVSGSALEESGTDPAVAASDPVVIPPEPENDQIADLINDTQPELRQLVEPADHATTQPDIEPVIADQEDDSDSGDTHTIKTIEDPDATPAADAPVGAQQDAGDDAGYSLDDALAVDADATNRLKALTTNLDAIAKNGATAATADTSDSQLELPTLSNSMRVEALKESDAVAKTEAAPAATENPPAMDEVVQQPATDNASPESSQQVDEEAAMAAELEAAYALEQQASSTTGNTEAAVPQPAATSEPISPAQVDEEAAMAAELEMAYTLEQQDSADAGTAEAVSLPDATAEPDTPESADDEAAMAAELEMAYALEQQQSATNEAAVADKAEQEISEDSHTGIFENLDPLPDLDYAAQDGLVEPVKEAGAKLQSNEDSGEVTVTDLEVSAIRSKPRQDIGALEDALESAKQGTISSPPAPEPAAAASSDKLASSDLPEITLDQSISDEQPKKADIDKFAAEIGTANSLEEFSDAMAETLFGSEAFDQIAADVVANPPDAGTSPLEEMDKQSPVKLDETDMPGAANEAIEDEVTELSLEETSSQAVVEEKPVAEEKPAAAVAAPKPTPPKMPTMSDGGEVPLNESVAMRIDILNKMKSNVAKMAMENVELGESTPPPKPDSGEPKPESIEDQIDTSITQTLKAVDIARMDAEAAAEEKEEKKSGGLFSRFRKSS